MPLLYLHNYKNTVRALCVALFIAFCTHTSTPVVAQVIEPASITPNTQQNTPAQTPAAAPTTESAAQQTTPTPTLYEFVPPEASDFSTYTPQTDAGPDAINQVVIFTDLTPEYPSPYQDVTIALDSYTTKLDSNTISWFVDGKLITKGIGLKTFTIKAGAIGTQKVVTASVLADNGHVTQQKIIIAPAAVDLIWQAQSYTPPFYKGKALIPHQGAVLVTAEPTIYQAGKRIPAKQLIYKWKQEDTVLVAQSGYGKNTALIEPNLPLDAQKISVEVTTVDGKIKAANFVRLTSQNPIILLYEEDALTGVRSQQAITVNHSVKGKDSKIVAVPFFFSTPKRSSGSIQYNWLLNGQDTGQHASAITLGVVDGTQGNATIQLEIKHTSKIFQAADTLVPIYFEKNVKTPLGF